MSLLAASLLGVPAGPACAFDLFGLFGSNEPPPPSPSTLPYAVEVVVVGDDEVTAALQDASNLYKLRQDAPPDGEALVQRLRADFGPMLDALWGAGFYNARLTARVADITIDLARSGDEAAVRAANGFRNRAVVPITITAETGPPFKLRTVTVLDRATGRPFAPDDLPPRIVKVRPGDPARAADLRAADARLVDWFRSRSFPKVAVPLPDPTVDHVALTMDVAYVVDTGPKAGIGAVAITAPAGFDPAIVRSFIYLQPGQPYSPKALADTRKSIASIPAVGSVRIREADHFDTTGNLPLAVDVADRARNLVGFTAGFSTVDGPTGSVYYENRNLFGGAESLRLEGDLFLAPRIDGTVLRSFKDFMFSDIGERLKMSFIKPALGGSRVDLLVDGIAERNRVGGGRFGGYEDRFVGGTAALRYRVDETLSAQAGIKVETGFTRDVLGKVDYTLVGLPIGVKYDTTDSPLNPTTGVRLGATLTPYPGVLGSSVGFTRATAGGSAYYALDDEGRYVLAGRAGVGSVFADGAALGTIPANYRFYEGGLATLRGYRYQTVGPSGPRGFTIGGLSSLDASLEARIRITESIGIAPFFDIGGAYRGEVPFDERGATRSSAGLGLLYYTPIGPIRVDVATPLNPRPGDRLLVLYVSIGQSF